MNPSRPAHLAVAIMASTLVDGPATVQDITDATGLTGASVRGYVRAMRKQKAIHIAAWEYDAAGRLKLAAYQFGRAPDAKRKPPRTRAEIARHYRARKKDALMLGVRQ